MWLSRLMPISLHYLPYQQQLHHQLLVSAIEGLRGVVINLLQALLPQCVQDLEQGAVVTVQQQRFRVRRLPLVPSGTR